MQCAATALQQAAPRAHLGCFRLARPRLAGDEHALRLLERHHLREGRPIGSRQAWTCLSSDVLPHPCSTKQGSSKMRESKCSHWRAPA